MIEGAMLDVRPPTILLRTPPFVLALAGVFMGCVMDAVIKHLGAQYNAVVIGFWRYAFGTVVSYQPSEILTRGDSRVEASVIPSSD
jgi:hypothetical protein